MQMKSLLVTVTFMLITGFAGHKGDINDELAIPIEQVIPLTDITPELSKELLSGQLPDVAIECKEGVELPIKYLCKAGFISFKYEPNLSFKIEKTCYLRLIKKGRCFMSFDLKTWKKPDVNLLDTTIGISPDKSHILVETAEDPIYKLQ
jgi:hypothetical protein